MRWPWNKKQEKSSEAREHLDRVLAREPEVKHLARELKEAQRRNHFSQMVITAMGRGPERRGLG